MSPARAWLSALLKGLGYAVLIALLWWFWRTPEVDFAYWQL